MSDPAVSENKMSAAAAPLLMRTRVKAILYVLVVLSGALFSITQQDVTALFLCTLAAAVAWLWLDHPRPSVSPFPPSQPQAATGFWSRQFRRDGGGLPKIALNLIVLGGAVYLLVEVLDAWGNRSLIAALSHFILLLMACKLFQEKTVRDIVQVVLLSLMLVISSAMFSNSGLFYALMLAVYIGILVCGAMLLHLGAESQVVAHQKISAALPDISDLARVRTDLYLVARNSVLLLLPMAVIVFLLFPRSHGPAFATPWNIGPYQTGFRDTVQFHDSGQLMPSDEIALHLKMYRGDGTPYCPDVSDLYIRGEVLSEYSPRAESRFGIREASWQPARELSMDTKPVDSVPPRKTWTDDRGSLTAEEYTIEVPMSHTRFVQGPIVPPNKANLAYDPADMTLRNNSNINDMLKYTVYSPPRQEWFDWECVPESLSFVTPGLLRPKRSSPNGEIPEVMVSPQISAMARELAKAYLPPEGEPIPVDSIRLVMNIYETYLRTHYPYSLSFQQVDPNLDPTTDFLLNRKATGGHCEYFASAMVMLCRAVGLNARMVTGFHGGEFNVVDDSYTLRQKDAHAWAEVYVPQQGWVPSDPSPIQSNLAGSGDYSLWRWGSELGQMLQNYWLSLVVSFDDDSRKSLWTWVGNRLQAVGIFFSDLVAAANRADMAVRIAVFGPLLGLMILGGWAVKRWRGDRRKLRDARGSPWRAMVALSGGVWFLEELFSTLARHGTSRRMDQTPREYVDAFIGPLGDAARDANWLIDLGYEVRFGALEINGSLRSKVNASLKHVKLSLAGK